MNPAVYERMKQLLVMFAFGGCIALIGLSFFYHIKRFVLGVVKKVRKRQEKKHPKEQNEET